jgi:hypothetical protein
MENYRLGFIFRRSFLLPYYHAGIAPVDAQEWCDNLIDVLEFILDDEVELLKNLNIVKL